MENTHVPGEISFTRRQGRDGRFASRAVGVAVGRRGAEGRIWRTDNVARGQRTLIEFKPIVAGQEVIEQIVAAGVGQLEQVIIAAILDTVAVLIEQIDADAGNARTYAVILNSIAVDVMPDEIANRGAGRIVRRRGKIIPFVTFADRRRRIYCDGEGIGLTLAAIGGQAGEIKRNRHGRRGWCDLRHGRSGEAAGIGVRIRP